jgi:hypothetical protein
VGESMTPSNVMSAITDPAPDAIAQVDTWKAPGIPLARRAEVAPAATIIAIRRKMLIQLGPRKSNKRTEPTATICTSPRTIATARSFSR